MVKLVKELPVADETHLPVFAKNEKLPYSLFNQ